jgi:bifunctional DNA-binding transcriptional regulator/antitoxin component of YhaV-PrlF toxin-antitoxin module
MLTRLNLLGSRLMCILELVGKSKKHDLMAKRLSARIRPKNQITLPQRLVDHTGLKEGDFLDFEIITTEIQAKPGMILIRSKKLVEAEIPSHPVPPIREDQEFPGVKTAIEELKKRLK